MAQRKVLLAAYDVGPSRAFAKLKEQLGERAVLCVCNGSDDRSPSGPDLLQSVRDADIALVGMSSQDTCPFERLVADQVYENGKPIAFFADTFGAWRREWFAGFRTKKAAAVFIASDPERNAAQHTFPFAEVVVSGNPLWEDYLPPGTPHEAAQQQRAARTHMGFRGDEHVVLISGTKKEDVNLAMLDATLRAADGVVRSMGVAPRLRYVFGRHPGDRTDQRVYRTKALGFPQVPFSFLPEGMRADDAVPGLAALVHPGNSSLAMHCIVRGKGLIRVIDAPFPGIDEYLKAEVGGWEYTLNAIDASYRPPDIESLAEAFVSIGTGNDNLACRPPPDLVHVKPGQAAARIIETLDSL